MGGPLPPPPSGCACHLPLAGEDCEIDCRSVPAIATLCRPVHLRQGIVSQQSAVPPVVSALPVRALVQPLAETADAFATL